MTDNFEQVFATQVQLISELVRERDALILERDHYKRCVEWYASSEQWQTLTDDRGRDTFTFRWGDDGGFMARTSLRRWSIVEESAPASGPVGAAAPSVAGSALGEAGPDA